MRYLFCCRQTNISLGMGGNVEVEVVLGRFSIKNESSIREAILQKIPESYEILS